MKTPKEIQDAFKERESKEIELHGTKYRFTVKDHLIEIRQMGKQQGGWQHHFIAELLSDGFLSFDIDTRGKDGGPNHDLYAAELVQLSLEYFKKTRGGIRGIHAQWVRNTNLTNYAQFIEKKNLGIEEAAKQTWTGKLAAKLGYKKCEYYSEDEDYIEFRFF
jgi:hypothetical protein